MSAALVLATLLQGSTPSPPPSGPGCNSPESHQWDFWVGSWEVRPNGAEKVIAHSLIEKKYTGCAIRENWMPVGRELNGGGGSLSFYDPARKKWRQVWIDSSGTRVDLDGGFEDGAMMIVGEWANFVGPGKGALVKMRYQLQPDGQVRQWSEASTDGGKTWSPGFDFLYRRAPLPHFK
ncbi:DUF1579 domain-containing protein [Sphingomonas sp. HDW15A]|uniref:DUF1579 domain-containing protein n=1 Tax=Sphingomonas sp. HDW15A TaxID=2714942 RepID=UPI00140ADCAD|nr:DUF1579 domain-containing protein [Sphingomonas sp. HDW15A]QIK96030.1 DUF1579 domain-containing protein [Sphingomonas sp. HDW15A]